MKSISEDVVTGMAGSFREQVALRAFEQLLEGCWPLCGAEDSWTDACCSLAARVLVLTDEVCRAMAEPATETATGDGIQNERDRCVAILKAAKDKAIKEAEYAAGAALRDCSDLIKTGPSADQVMG